MRHAGVARGWNLYRGGEGTRGMRWIADRVVELLRDRADVCEIAAATILTLPHQRLMSHENLVSSVIERGRESRDYRQRRAIIQDYTCVGAAGGGK